MTQSYTMLVMKDDKYLSNLLGAFATSLSGSIETQIAALQGRSLNHEAALVASHYHPEETIDSLSKVLNLTHSGTVRLVNTLEQSGLLQRHKSQRDARSVVLCTTDAGAERVAQILQQRDSAIQQVLRHLTAAQKQQFMGLLEVAMGQLSEEPLAARRICRLCDESVCRKEGCPVELALKS